MTPAFFPSNFREVVGSTLFPFPPTATNWLGSDMIPAFPWPMPPGTWRLTNWKLNFCPCFLVFGFLHRGTIIITIIQVKISWNQKTISFLNLVLWLEVMDVHQCCSTLTEMEKFLLYPNWKKIKKLKQIPNLVPKHCFKLETKWEFLMWRIRFWIPPTKIRCVSSKVYYFYECNIFFFLYNLFSVKLNWSSLMYTTYIFLIYFFRFPAFKSKVEIKIVPLEFPHLLEMENWLFGTWKTWKNKWKAWKYDLNIC